jgi:murein DD-endopeptidase MepM/ murein hydrolase activator NlpD
MKEKRFIFFAFGMLVFVSMLAGTLMFEVYFFKQYVHQLVALKEDYENYRQGLRRIIAERQGLYSESMLKKKVPMSLENSFSPVNRDYAYLQHGACLYARDQGMEELWKIQSCGQLLQKKGAAKRPSRVNQTALSAPRTLLVDRDALSIIREHSFILPIDRHLFRISSRFGPRRRRDGSWGFHYGLDMAAPHKTPVRAIAHGVIVEAGPAKGFGNTVVIVHSNKLKSRYAHLARYQVKVGDTIEQGQLIGLVGNTGNVRGRNGIHLHIELLLYGKRIDPWYVFNELRNI